MRQEKKMNPERNGSQNLGDCVDLASNLGLNLVGDGEPL